MGKIHYFQRYSQKENVITNNTLLLFSRLYNFSPQKFKQFLNELTEEFDINVGVTFSQQEKTKNAIPDGSITQDSFKIVIETKLSDNFSIKQLYNHLKVFKSENSKILLALSPIKPKSNIVKNLIEEIKNFNIEHNFNIGFINVTFKEIVSKYRDVINDYDIELNSIIDDYEEFCISERMIRNTERMLAVGCGYTLKSNFSNNVYFDPVNRGYSYCTHLGIYNNKSIRGIGKIENIITADLNDKNELIIKETTNGQITQIQEKNIISIIKETKETLGWNISNEHKFFCVDKFVKTDFKKESKNGLFGKKYFDINKLTGKNEFENTEKIAELLNDLKW